MQPGELTMYSARSKAGACIKDGPALRCDQGGGVIGGAMGDKVGALVTGAGVETGALVTGALVTGGLVTGTGAGVGVPGLVPVSSVVAA